MLPISPLPYVQIDKVVPEDTQGTVDKGLGVMLTITNTGTVDVATNIRCYEGVDEADMATIFVSLEAGQTKTSLQFGMPMPLAQNH